MRRAELHAPNFFPFPAEGHLYRCVSKNHPATDKAESGSVEPAVSSGGASAKQHSEGGHSDNSQYTSWTRDVEIARWHANKDGPIGVMLSAPLGGPGAGDCWP